MFRNGENRSLGLVKPLVVVGKEAFFFALEWPLNMDLTGKLKTQQTKIFAPQTFGYWPRDFGSST